ncbi:uncharacterized protein N7469_002293 [Penicillium citrinum]|uniref:Uncharacterized protein n=1 Tax=Penicillium citrinum TaxID=5077 RepID=A0A9W9PD43_PENCI|nr:uncharacterized protein N7469_002293 [Penicillium citrinum]KAJ5240702.1 hypothetical protein N7469_002293 [Penicillium citrinum]
MPNTTGYVLMVRFVHRKKEVLMLLLLMTVDVLGFLWSSLKHVDILTYQAPSQIEDPFMPRSKVGYTLASVDKFDGLNKNMKDWDTVVYGRQFNVSCRDSGTTTIEYPNDKYILVEMATTPSFQHALTVLHAYKGYHELLKYSTSPERLPKTSSLRAPNVKPPEQIWNTLLSKAELVILFYDPEDYEERFLEAVQKGKTVLRTEPLGPYGSLLEKGTKVLTVGVADVHAMSQSLFQNLTLGDHQHLCNFLPNNVWDVFTTAGNAVNWFFLASTLTKGDCVEPHGEYIYRLAQRRAKDIR